MFWIGTIHAVISPSWYILEHLKIITRSLRISLSVGLLFRPESADTATLNTREERNSFERTLIALDFVTWLLSVYAELQLLVGNLSAIWSLSTVVPSRTVWPPWSRATLGLAVVDYVTLGLRGWREVVSCRFVPSGLLAQGAII